jgi:hypothetical protein
MAPLSSPCLDTQAEKEIQTTNSHILSTMLTATRLLECCCLLDDLITDLTTRTADLKPTSFSSRPTRPLHSHCSNHGDKGVRRATRSGAPSQLTPSSFGLPRYEGVVQLHTGGCGPQRQQVCQGAIESRLEGGE